MRTIERVERVREVAPERGGDALRSRADAALAVLEAMPIGVLIEHPDGDTWMNSELRRMLRRDDAVRRSRAGDGVRGDLPGLSDLLRPRRRGWPVPTMRRPLGTAWARHQLDRGDGTTCHVLVAKRQLTADGRGDVDTTFVIEEARPESDAQVRRIFLAMIGHELRTPITSIVGGAELLRDAALDAATRAEVTALLVEEANRVHQLVGQLTALSTLQTADRPEPEPVHVVHLSRAVAATEARRRRGVRIDGPNLDPTIPAALGDEAAIAQVLAILIDNAAKHAGPQAQIEVAVEKAGDDVVLHVLDRGPGLPEGDHDKLFALFERAGASDAGTGIGLYVARQLVLGMGGRISAATREGGGADFAIALPAAR